MAKRCACAWYSASLDLDSCCFVISCCLVRSITWSGVRTECHALYSSCTLMVLSLLSSMRSEEKLLCSHGRASLPACVTIQFTPPKRICCPSGAGVS